MDNQDFSVLFVALMISCSGIIVNLIKRGKSEKIRFTEDGTSLLWFRVGVPLALVISLLFYFLKIGAISFSILSVYAGYFLVIFGLACRWVAIVSLGKAFTVKVSILEAHTLKTDGIYKYIRHPSYTGLLMYYIGLGLVMQNWICVLILFVFPCFVVMNRIRIEEQALLENFPTEYNDYQKRSWRLFPFLF